MKINKIFMLAVLGSFALPFVVVAEDKDSDKATKTEEQKVEKKEEKPVEAKKSDETKSDEKASDEKKSDEKATDGKKDSTEKKAKKKKSKKSKKWSAGKAKKAKSAENAMCDANVAPQLPAAPSVPAALPTISVSTTPERYMKVTDNTFIGINGKVQAVANYDLNGFAGDALEVGGFSYDGAQTKQNLNANASASQLAINALSKTSAGDVHANVTCDFLGGLEAGYPDDIRSTDYKLRMLYAYVEVKGFLFGQYDSLYGTYPTLPTVDASGHFGDGTRQFQLRYTYDTKSVFNFAVALENAAADFMTSTGVRYASSTSTYGSTYTRESRLPDLSMRAGFKFGEHELAFRSLLRQLGLKYTDNNGALKSLRKTTWAAGTDLKLTTMKNSAFVAVFNYGYGLGHYIDGQDGQSMVVGLDINNDHVAKLQRMCEWGLGYSQGLGDAWQVNLGYSQSTVAKSNLLAIAAAGETTSKIQRYFFNVMWTPVKDLTIGLEYAQGARKSVRDTNNAHEKATRRRIDLGVKYNF